MIGSSAHPHAAPKVGKRKAGLEAKSLREGTTHTVQAQRPASKSKQTGFKSGRSQSAPGQGGSGVPGGKAKKPKPAAKGKKVTGKKSKGGEGEDEDDIEGLKDEEDVSDEDDEAFQVAEAKGLEAARA